MADGKNENGNGTLSKDTRIRLSLGIPLVMFIVGCVGWINRVENHITNDDQDPFRGADMDRMSGRIQWGWQDYALHAGLESYPKLPPWRAGTTYTPTVIKMKNGEHQGEQ